MDLNEKVEQLVQITTALKNEVNELKGNDLHTKLDELQWEKEALKNDIIDLRRKGKKNFIKSLNTNEY